MFIEFYHMVTKQDLFKYVYPSSMLTLSQLRTEDIFNPQGGKKKTSVSYMYTNTCNARICCLYRHTHIVTLTKYQNQNPRKSGAHRTAVAEGDSAAVTNARSLACIYACAHTRAHTHRRSHLPALGRLPACPLTAYVAMRLGL